MAYTVGEMARRLGVPASTIRYYDKEIDLGIEFIFKEVNRIR